MPILLYLTTIYLLYLVTIFLLYLVTILTILGNYLLTILGNYILTVLGNYILTILGNYIPVIILMNMHFSSFLYVIACLYTASVAGRLRLPIYTLCSRAVTLAYIHLV